MDIDKSLYMKDFLEVRKSLGTIINSQSHHILNTNLYNEFLPREKKIKVKQVVEEIEEKTIHILSKGAKGVKGAEDIIDLEEVYSRRSTDLYFPISLELHRPKN